ncbi:rCG60646 [Rattus norvegicus]|uniref:RCG60646 n=1 Tax=Rattus norvegicus TaxID=10116 RepID=A6JK43_RAT|nr:rCG60646 [Rattus norvegicus]
MAAGIYYRIPLAAVSCAYSGHISEDLEPKWFSSFRALVPDPSDLGLHNVSP